MPRAKGRQVIAGLDVGTTKSCCVIAEWSPVGNLDIIGVGVSPCRGLRKGAAMVSDKHCNFLINTGDATAADIESLGEEVRRRVKAQSGVDLQWEIRRIGISARRGAA